MARARPTSRKTAKKKSKWKRGDTVTTKRTSFRSGDKGRLRKLVGKSYVKGLGHGAKAGAAVGAIGTLGAVAAARVLRKKKKEPEEQLQQTVVSKLIERGILFESPQNVVDAWSKKMGVPKEEAERRWKEAEKAAKKQGHSPSEGDDFYKYTMGIYKTMMYQNKGQNKGGRGTKAIKRDAR